VHRRELVHQGEQLVVAAVQTLSRMPHLDTYLQAGVPALAVIDEAAPTMSPGRYVQRLGALYPWRDAPITGTQAHALGSELHQITPERRTKGTAADLLAARFSADEARRLLARLDERTDKEAHRAA